MSEEELIGRCVRGDESACAALVARYQVMVFTVVERLVRDRGVTEDLAQEAFMRVFRGLPGFRGQARLSTWIYQIAYRVCLEELDRPRYRRPRAEVNVDDLTDGLPSPAAAEEMAEVDRRQAAEYWLSRLPPAYRMALILYYREDRSYTEIAQVMQLPLGTAKTYLHRARRYLRDHLLEVEAP